MSHPPNPPPLKFPLDCPILVWMLYLNREMTPEECGRVYSTVQTCVPHASVNGFSQEQGDSIRQTVSYLMPLLMMRHRRIPRQKWKDVTGPNGRRWIETDPDSAHTAQNPKGLMIGYQLAVENNLVGMVMTQGPQRDVVNLGIGIKQIGVSPPDADPMAYAESYHHRLTAVERTFIAPEFGVDVVLRRLCILLCLKQAYIRAIGQPMGFDWSRLEFNIENHTARGDQLPLQGWEFRLWKADIGVKRDNQIKEESYQCACAFYRGTPDCRFIWQSERRHIETWVQFINLDQLFIVLPKLLD